MFRVDKKHSRYLDELLDGREYTKIDNDKPAGLYYCRLRKKNLAEVIGVIPKKKNSWWLYRKRPIRKDHTTKKHQYYMI